ncbi:hypothetical protein PPUJ20028_46390 [Pseudomonas putida]|uniref:Uncharacterized protein n=1 Tax=Pseudomonas putida TaxID=303 RepID=A0AA37RIK4_PSEPU|nr:hypothetical protein [Pseudomonas putida]GLO16053.1 hypothetical protein PPUJ20028_46390 [Pseudomonas putida]GLO37888.1 hypothetical protein PPUN14671_47250 [Pseudomonas putida]HDS0965099.1 hypothetical protein [Pseudomonas putida]HDS0991481.1 hypothetical protein [Pseudomonas putida]
MASGKKDDWFSSALPWIIVAALGPAVIILVAYWYNLGPVSHDHGPWSSFGSLLSGVFMVASTCATLATLMFLAHQNKQIQDSNRKQQEVTDKQLAAVNFEQYVNHRRYFMERLGELQSAFGNRFVFEDADELYSKVFPRNSPINLEFTAEVNGSLNAQNYLGKLCYQLGKLDDFSKAPDWNRSGGRRLIGLLIDLSVALNLRMVDEPYDGDVVFNGKRTFINIYSSNEFIELAKAIFNSFLFYTGNEKFSGFDIPMGRSASDSLMAYVLSAKEDPAVFDVVKAVPGLEIMEQIYFNLFRMRHEDFWFLQPSYATLMDAFSSRIGVMQLKNKEFVDQIVDVGCCAASTALKHSSEEGEGYELLRQTHELFNLLLARNL